MPHAVCPACEEETYVSVRLQEGDLIRCRNCREELEVIDTDPYELDWPYDDNEDDWEAESESDEDEDEEEEAESWDGDDDEDEAWDASEEEDEEPEYQRRARR